MQANKIAVKTGLDILSGNNFELLKDKKIGLLIHQASVDKNLNSILDLILELKEEQNIEILKIFGPEHGFSGAAQDMEEVISEASLNQNIPVISLYGASKDTLKINPEELEEIDFLICDLQDIGSRYYTFANTIGYAMQSCAESNTHCLVLDRPNPINATDVEGNIVHSDFISFVGAYPIANRHGMTMGELANLFNSLNPKPCSLEVTWMENYKRVLFFDEIDLPWVAPSPNMPTLDTAIPYPGGCLIEGTNLSEGRGTTKPFEIIGAAYIDNPERFAALISSQIELQNISGVKIRPTYFKPMFHKFANQSCGGVQIHVTNRKTFEPLKTYIALIWAAMHFEGFDWRQEPYEFENDKLAIDLLFGSNVPRKMLENKKNTQEICDSLLEDKKHFISMRAKYLHEDYSK